MTGTVFVVTSGKGGVGKSTTALNLGVALALDDHAVALVDADLGMPNLGELLGMESDTTLHDVLAGEAGVESAIVSEAEEFGIVLGSPTLDGYAAADPGRLPDVLATLSETYEYVVVDAGAGLGYADVVPVDAADEVILVTTPTNAATGDAGTLAAFAERVGAPIRGVVVTRADGTADAEAIASDLDTDLLGIVPEDMAVPASAAANAPLEHHAPDSPAAKAYRRLARALSGRDAGATGRDDTGVDDESDTDDGASVSDGEPESGERDTESDVEASNAGDVDDSSEPEPGASEKRTGAETNDTETNGTAADRPDDDAGETSNSVETSDEQAEPGAVDEGASDATDQPSEGEDATGKRGGLLSRIRGLF